MSMYPHTAGTNVCGHCKVWEPEVLNVDLPEGRLDGRVELASGEHGRRRVRQVKQLFPPLRHFLGEHLFMVYLGN